MQIQEKPKTHSKKAETSSYERIPISKSLYLSLFNVFFFLDEIFYHFRKSRGPRALRTCADQGPHTVHLQNGGGATLPRILYPGLKIKEQS